MQRPDLIVPYVEPKESAEPDMSGAMASVFPMMAIVTRNKMFGWTAVLFSVQSWLLETPVSRKRSSSPAYFTVGMALMSAIMAYLPLFLPPTTPKVNLGSGTDPPAPQPI